VGLETVQEFQFTLHFALRPAHREEVIATGRVRYEPRQVTGAPARTLDAALHDRIRRLKA
jgi:hypothetical protein